MPGSFAPSCLPCTSYQWSENSSTDRPGLRAKIQITFSMPGVTGPSTMMRSLAATVARLWSSGQSGVRSKSCRSSASTVSRNVMLAGSPYRLEATYHSNSSPSDGVMTSLSTGEGDALSPSTSSNQNIDAPW